MLPGMRLVRDSRVAIAMRKLNREPMKPDEILRIVDAIHRDKNIDKEIVFEAIEAALVTALARHYGENAEIVIQIDREDGRSQRHPRRRADRRRQELAGRIGAQTAKQVIIQKIREAERDAIHDEYEEQIGQMVSGVVTALRRGARPRCRSANTEAILPRSEQIPGETLPRQRADPGHDLRGPQVRAAGSRSSSRGSGPTSCSGCSSRKSPRSPTA